MKVPSGWTVAGRSRDQNMAMPIPQKFASAALRMITRHALQAVIWISRIGNG